MASYHFLVKVKTSGRYITGMYYLVWAVDYKCMEMQSIFEVLFIRKFFHIYPSNLQEFNKMLRKTYTIIIT